jgi:hypothetical protein
MENLSNLSSEEKLLRLREEGKISEDEYLELKNSMSKSLQSQAVASSGYRFIWSFQYRSKKTLWGLPLIDIIYGLPFDPQSGRFRVAKGVIAIGPVSLGIFAFGGFSLGMISFGGLAVGLVALGGFSLGLLLAIGGLAVGFVAMGGAAIGYYAIGGGAFGVHALGGNAKDPKLVEFFEKLLGWKF